MKKIFVLSLFLSLSILISCQQSGSSGNATLKFNILGVNKTENVTFDNETLLQIISKNHAVKIKEPLYTKYLYCIDEVCNEGDYSWVYYLNDKPLSLSTAVYKPKNGDFIELRYGVPKI